MQDKNEYIFQDRVVVFLDVLGFKEKLKEFEKEANTNFNKGSEYFHSEKVNDFISTFKDAISTLDEANLNYYLFSDNICITVDYLSDQKLLPNLLLKISDLFYSFASKGYFIRGAIDVGKFVDEKLIAVGMPLATAYELEGSKAIYPRIVLSENFTKLTETYNSETNFEYADLFSEGNLILSSCEIKYLNVFFNIINKENKYQCLDSLHKSLIRNLENTSKNEQIHIKYEWLKNEFNDFIDVFLDELIFTDSEQIPSDSEIEQIRKLKILQYGS